jgi:hypothetical protein
MSGSFPCVDPLLTQLVMKGSARDAFKRELEKKEEILKKKRELEQLQEDLIKIRKTQRK